MGSACLGIVPKMYTSVFSINKCVFFFFGGVIPTRMLHISVFGICGIKTSQDLVSDSFSVLMVIHTRGKRSQRPSSEMVGILIDFELLYIRYLIACIHD